MRVGRGAHACLIGKEPARHAVTYGLLDRDADEASGRRCGVEGALEYHPEGVGNLREVHDENGRAADEVKRRHQWNELFRDGGDTSDAAKEYITAHRGEDDADIELIPAEGDAAGVRDRVCLHRVADETQSDDERHGEEDRKRFAVQSVRYIEGWAADHSAVRLLIFEDLCQCRLGEDCRHAQKGGDPHPKDRSRSAHSDGGGRAREISCSYLPGDRRGESLEGAHAALVCPFAEEVDTAEDLLERLRELPNLYESEPDSEIKSRPAKKRNETPQAPDKAVNVGYQLRELFHESSSSVFCRHYCYRPETAR